LESNRHSSSTEIAAKPPDVAIHDHLVIGRTGHASFRELGLL